MAARIGIALGHHEAVTPATSGYGVFFEMLRAEGRRTQGLDGELTAAALRGFDAVLLGQPRAWLREGELRALGAWVEAGGALLALASLGGDENVGGERRSSSNLGKLAPGLGPAPDALGIAREAGHDGQFPFRAFDREVPVDVSALVREPATLRYVDGCTLARAAPALPLVHALPAPPGASVVRYVIDEDELYAYEPEPAPATGDLLASVRRGAGTVSLFGAARSFHDEHLRHEGNRVFLAWLFLRWLPRLAADEVWNRKRRPQRHRLLHGYPMAPLMPEVTPEDRLFIEETERALAPDAGRGLIVGVLPHPFCNPSVKGCGFCTFPHEVFGHERAATTVDAVCREVDAVTARSSPHARRPVAALYLGGGTANLTPREPFEKLGATLSARLDLADAEVTLEGVPAYFVARHARRGGTILDALRSHLPARHHRISMGIQSFDPEQLARMGRARFGDRAKMAEVVRAAHDRGITVSGDLLFDLPGQTFAQMAEDVDVAVGLGLDHVCLYHLVLFEGLGTEWSLDRSLLAQLPDNRRACDHWVALRERLLAHGFVQTSLTNFERADVHASGRRFLYEDCAYRPERYDLLGFGPSAISLLFGPGLAWALKRTNPDGATDYAGAVAAGDLRGRSFRYAPRDVRVLFLTRKVVTLAWRRSEYRSLFGADPLDDFPDELAALRTDRLLSIAGDEVALTPKGMFYADTVAALFAWRRVQAFRLRALGKGEAPRPRPARLYDVNNSSFDIMG